MVKSYHIYYVRRTCDFTKVVIILFFYTRIKMVLHFFIRIYNLIPMKYIKIFSLISIIYISYIYNLLMHNLFLIYS